MNSAKFNLLILAITAMVSSCHRTSDEAGTRLLKMVERFDTQDRLSSVTTYYPGGEMDREVSYSDDGTVQNMVICRYDDQRRLVERVDSALDLRFRMRYDSLGRPIYSSNSILGDVRQVRMRYTDHGRLRIDSIDPMTALTYSRLDESGNVTSFVMVMERDTTTYGEIRYDNENRKIWENRVREGRPIFRDSIVYNGQGLMEFRETYDPIRRVVHQTSNEYDDRGRWTRAEVRYNDGRPDVIHTYEYEGSTRLEHTWKSGEKVFTRKEIYQYYPQQNQHE